MNGEQVTQFPDIGTLVGGEYFYIAYAGRDYKCTTDEIKTYVGSNLLTTINRFTKNQSVIPVSVTTSGSYAADASASNNFQITMNGNLTLAAPTNLTTGMVLNFCLDEDATGGRTITLNTIFKFPGGAAPIWTTTANARNFFSGYYDGTVIRCGGGSGYA